MQKFYGLHPEFMSDQTAKSFLEIIHDVLHVEVKKLHPDTLLPGFEYESSGDTRLTMRYTSLRKLCHLAEGLIIGTTDIFSEKIDMVHSECMYQGANLCRLELGFA